MKNTIEKNGVSYRLSIWHDDNASNPFVDWDCEPPIHAGGEYKINDDEVDEVVEEAITTYDLVEKNALALFKRFEEDLHYGTDIDLEFINKAIGGDEEAMDEFAEEMHNLFFEFTLEDKAFVLDLAGIPNKLHESRGHSQGDYAKILIVLSDEYIERVGLKEEHYGDALESSSKLFDSWAWGDVYGFTIEKEDHFLRVYPDGMEIGDSEWVLEESCGGFYGRNHRESGLLEEVGEEWADVVDDIEIEYRR